jgi:Flp pilus assembly protein TadD
MYLAGHAALNGGDNTGASAYFAQAARASGSEEVREEAFYAAVLSGDISRASALKPTAELATPGAARMSRLVVAVDSMASGKAKQAYAALSGEPIGYPHRAAAALLKPWVAAAAGDMAAATAEPELKSDRLAYALGNLSRARLLEKAGKAAEAEAVLKAATDQDASGNLFIEAYGEFLERRNRQDEAVALYDKALARTPADGNLLSDRARAAARRAPPALPSFQNGASEAMVGAAAGAMLLKQSDLGLIYIRLALHLQPKNDEAWMMLGDTQSAGGDDEAARAAYAHVGKSSAAFVDARTRTIWTYKDPADQAEALRLARETVKLVPDSDLAKTTLAEVLRVNKAYAESAAVLDGVIGAEGRRADWRLYYLRAIALDKAGRWSDAERDLKMGLSLNPNESELLNYLGYTWIVRGERLDEALGMIRTAVAADPESGAVVDSLGWAYFRLGQYPKAVEQLEKASQLEPADAEINTHLGDAYWKTGRQIEARFQWRKVLTTMKPDDQLKMDLETRIKVGLDGDVTAAKVANR